MKCGGVEEETWAPFLGAELTQGTMCHLSGLQPGRAQVPLWPFPQLKPQPSLHPASPMVVKIF